MCREYWALFLFQALYCPLVVVLIIAESVPQIGSMNCSSARLLFPKHCVFSEENFWSWPQGLIPVIQIALMNLSHLWVESAKRSEVPAGLMHTKQERMTPYALGLLIAHSMHYLQVGALWTNSKHSRSFVSQLTEWKLFQLSAALASNASAQNKWRKKLSAINTYGRPKIDSK